MTTALGAAPVPRTLDASVVHWLLSTLDVASPAGQSEIVSPFTGTPMGSLPQASAEDVDDAVSALRAGQESWAQLPVAERARVLLRFHDLVLARRDEGLDIVQAEVGKSRRDYEQTGRIPRGIWTYSWNNDGTTTRWQCQHHLERYRGHLEGEGDNDADFYHPSDHDFGHHQQPAAPDVRVRMTRRERELDSLLNSASNFLASRR